MHAHVCMTTHTHTHTHTQLLVTTDTYTINSPVTIKTKMHQMLHSSIMLKMLNVISTYLLLCSFI